VKINQLAGHILLATPALNDPNFRDAVVLICHHDTEGGMGLIINRPRQIDMFEVLHDLGICMPDSSRDICNPLPRVFEGGPIDNFRGFVLHDGWHIYESTMQISQELHLTASRDVLEALGDGDGPEHYLLYLVTPAGKPGSLSMNYRTMTGSLPPRTIILYFRNPRRSAGISGRKAWE